MAETLILAASSATIGASTAAEVGLLASAGSTAAAGFSAALSAVPLISTGLTAASAFGAIAGGYQEQASYKAQAQQNELAARQEELKGRQQADNIRRSLQATLSSQNAAFAARGISLASGTPVNVGNVSRTQAAQDIETAQFGSGMAAGALRGTAAQNRMAGKAAVTAGYTSAATSLYAGRNSFSSLIA